MLLSRSKVTRKGPGIKTFIKRVKKPGSVEVGIIDAGQKEGTDITVAGVGFANEFGTETIPERSFLRSTTQSSKKQIVSLIKKLRKKVHDGSMGQKQALGLLGAFISDEVKKKIVAIKSPPNAPATIAKKGSSNPLVDTGQLKNSITWEVNP